MEMAGYMKGRREGGRERERERETGPLIRLEGRNNKADNKLPHQNQSATNVEAVRANLLDQYFPNLSVCRPLWGFKNNNRSSNFCSRIYRFSGRYVSKVTNLYLTTDFR